MVCYLSFGQLKLLFQSEINGTQGKSQSPCTFFTFDSQLVGNGMIDLNWLSQRIWTLERSHESILLSFR